MPDGDLADEVPSSKENGSSTKLEIKGATLEEILNPTRFISPIYRFVRFELREKGTVVRNIIRIEETLEHMEIVALEESELNYVWPKFRPVDGGSMQCRVIEGVSTLLVDGVSYGLAGVQSLQLPKEAQERNRPKTLQLLKECAGEVKITDIDPFSQIRTPEVRE